MTNSEEVNAAERPELNLPLVGTVNFFETAPVASISAADSNGSVALALFAARRKTPFVAVIASSDAARSSYTTTGREARSAFFPMTAADRRDPSLHAATQVPALHAIARFVT